MGLVLPVRRRRPPSLLASSPWLAKATSVDDGPSLTSLLRVLDVLGTANAGAVPSAARKYARFARFARLHGEIRGSCLPLQQSLDNDDAYLAEGRPMA